MIEILELFEAVGRGVVAVVEGINGLSDLAEAFTSSKEEKKPDMPVDPGAPPDGAEIAAGSSRSAEPGGQPPG